MATHLTHYLTRETPAAIPTVATDTTAGLARNITPGDTAVVPGTHALLEVRAVVFVGDEIHVYSVTGTGKYVSWHEWALPVDGPVDRRGRQFEPRCDYRQRWVGNTPFWQNTPPNG